MTRVTRKLEVEQPTDRQPVLVEEEETQEVCEHSSTRSESSGPECARNVANTPTAILLTTTPDPLNDFPLCQRHRAG